MLYFLVHVLSNLVYLNHVEINIMFYLSLYPTTHIVKHLPLCRYSNNIFSLKVQVHVSVLQTVTESGLTLYKMTIYCLIHYYYTFLRRWSTMGRNTSLSKFINTYTHTYVQWNTTQLEERMKFCHLQQSGWTWITLSEISLTDKDEYCMVSLIHRI